MTVPIRRSALTPHMDKEKYRSVSRESNKIQSERRERECVCVWGGCATSRLDLDITWLDVLWSSI